MVCEEENGGGGGEGRLGLIAWHRWSDHPDGQVFVALLGVTSMIFSFRFIHVLKSSYR